jgi:hypothetical protein
MADFLSELKRIKTELKKTNSVVFQEGDPDKKLKERFHSGRHETRIPHVAKLETPPDISKNSNIPRTQSIRLHRNAPLFARAAEIRASKQNMKFAPPDPVANKVISKPIVSLAPNKELQPKVTGELRQITRGIDKSFQPLLKGELTRQKFFKLPENWVSLGGETQIDSDFSGEVDVFVGLDFGTSYTKAAVGFMDKIFPVNWTGISESSPSYLLPSEYTAFDDGSLFIGQHPNASENEIHGDLKLPFFDPAVSKASVFNASRFLALVLRYVRAWVFHYHGNKLGKKVIRWQFNLGVPSNGLEQSRLEAAYRTLAASAWIQSICNTPHLLADYKSGDWKDGDPLQDIVDFQVHPEFVAQMAGYMQSPQRQLGLHALVDVGGGTLDVVTFNVHKVDDEDTFPFLVPDIHPLGTHKLIQNRLLGLSNAEPRHRVDELAPIPSAEIFANMMGIGKEQVDIRDNEFSNEVSLVIGRVFSVTKTRRYRLSDAWKTEVRTFFTGGGAQVALYELALRAANVPAMKGLSLMPLPKHPKLDGFSGGVDEYQRISVACGLAQDSFTLGRIVPAKEVEDDKAVMATRSERLSRDELYAK